MPRYRINYIGRTRESPFSETTNVMTRGFRGLVRGEQYLHEIEYEDMLEAKTPGEALDAFFWQHIERREDVMIKGTDGRAHEITGVGDFDPAIAYLWMEDETMMEYQGLEEITPGAAVCPMCNGSGEVDEHLIDFYDEIAGRESAEA